MEKEILAYLAGVMDSDGYFTIKRDSYRLRVIGDQVNASYYEKVGIKQVSPIVIDLIKELFGGNRRTEKPNAKRGKLLHVVELSNLQAHKFVQAIYPYLRIKKRQAEILLELREKLKEPKKEIRYHEINSRWTKKIKVGRRCWSKEQIDYFEKLRQEIKSLNDTRSDKFHQPKPFERK